MQHLIAHRGNTQPPLFHAAMTSSTFLPSQYNYDDPVPEVSGAAALCVLLAMVAYRDIATQ